MISSIDNEGKLDLLPEYPKSSVPSAHEIRILEEVREALAPAVEFTKLQEKGSSTSGLLLCGLKMLVKKLAFDCSDLCKTFSNIVAARFSDPCSDPFYKIAALLDPRCCYFYKDNAEYRELLNSAIGVVQTHWEATGVSASSSTDTATLPPIKKRRGSIFDCMPTIREVLTASTQSTEAYNSFVAESMGFFMKMDTNIGQFWALNEAKIPILAELTKVYVLAPTSTWRWSGCSVWRGEWPVLTGAAFFPARWKTLSFSNTGKNKGCNSKYALSMSKLCLYFIKPLQAW